MKTNLKSKMKNELDLANLAPISVCVYSRLDHFKNCIESLLKNDLAKYSVLYVFSDAAKSGDEKIVSNIRMYAKSIKGFKKINLIFQKKNNYRKNVADVMSVPLKLHEKSIILEDDVVVQKSFLKFMNLALNIYEKDNDIFSISGYVGPENHLENSNEVQATQVFNGSGVGCWKKKYFEYLEDNKSLHPWCRLKKNIIYLIKCFLNFGIIFIMNIRRSFHKNLNYTDLFITEYIYRKRKIILMPSVSTSLNKGHDGSGYNCENSNRYQNEKLLRNNKFIFPLNFDRRLAHINTQRYLKSRNYKPNFFRQFYYLISDYYRPPNIIINIFKRLNF